MRERLGGDSDEVMMPAGEGGKGGQRGEAEEGKGKRERVRGTGVTPDAEPDMSSRQAWS